MGKWSKCYSCATEFKLLLIFTRVNVCVQCLPGMWATHLEHNVVAERMLHTLYNILRF